MTAIDPQPGSATIDRELWGAKARDWAERQEGRVRADFELCIRSTHIGQGAGVLDVGCGAGGFCRLAADTGASVTGIDAAAGMIEVARERTPNGRFDVGDIEVLPYENESFDVVTAFHSLPFAADPLAAIREARRVAKPGAPVFIVIFGRKERVQLAAVMGAIRSLLPTAPAHEPGPLALSPPGTLDRFLADAGLDIAEDCLIDTTYDYPDLQTALRAIGSAGPTVLSERTAGKDVVTKTIADALVPYRTPDGGYRLHVESRYVKATA